MADDKPFYDMAAFIKSKGLTFDHLDENKNVIVKNEMGELGRFPIEKVYKGAEQAGVDLSEMAMQFNTPEEAIPVSQVPGMDRFKLAFGNAKGNESYLRKNGFQDVRTDSEKGVLVKKDGVWTQLDPAFFGNASVWEVSKNIASAASKIFLPKGKFDAVAEYQDSGDLIKAVKKALPLHEYKELAKQGKEAILGMGRSLARKGALEEFGKDLAEAPADLVKQGLGAVGAHYLGTPGVGIGTGAGAYLNSSMGRVFGTYEGGRTEELFANTLDAAMNMVGHKIAMGTQPFLRDLDDSFKAFSKKFGQRTKDALATVWGGTTRTNPASFKYILNNADEFVSHRASIEKIVGSSNSGKIDEYTAQRSLKHMQTFLDESRPNLTAKQGELFDNLFNQAEKEGARFSSDVLSGNIGNSLEAAGIGKWELKEGAKQTVKKSAEELSELALQKSGGLLSSGMNLAKDETERQVSEPSKWVFRRFTPDEIKLRLDEGLPVELVPEQLDDAINGMVKHVNLFKEVGELRGKPAAKALLTLKRQSDFLLGGDFDSKAVKDSAYRIASIVDKSIDGTASKWFDDVGLSRQWTEIIETQKAYSNAVNWAQKIADSEGVGNLITKATRAAGKYGDADAIKNIQVLKDLNGRKGQALFNDIVKTDAVRNLNKAFNLSLPQIVAAGSATTGTALGFKATGASLLNPLVAAPIAVTAAQFSPKAVATEILASRKLIQWADALTPDVKRRMLENDEAFEAVLRQVVSSGAMQNETTQGLLQKISDHVGGQQNGQQ